MSRKETFKVYQDKTSVGTFEYVSFARFLNALTESCDVAEKSYPSAPIRQFGYGTRTLEILQDGPRVRPVETASGIRLDTVNGTKNTQGLRPPEETTMCYFPTGRKSGEWTEIWKNEDGKEVKVLEKESGIPYRVVPGDGTPAFHLTMEEYSTARKEGLAL